MARPSSASSPLTSMRIAWNVLLAGWGPSRLLAAGMADFIKLGAPQSYLKHKSEIEEISGGALPLGIVQDVTPMIVKKALKSGDFVYLFTDGISDSFPSEHALADFVNNQTSLNPQTLAEGLINHALTLAGGAKDDMTVIVAKVFATIN